MRFARNMGRHREAFANSLRARQLEDLPVPGGKRDHVGESRPGEADTGDIARPMNRVAHSKRLFVEPFGPAVRIIVDPDRAAASAHVDMMHQGKIFEPEIIGDIGEGAGKRLFRLDFAHIPDKSVYTAEHSPLRPCRDIPGRPSKYFISADALSTRCHTSVSQAESEAQGPSGQMHDQVRFTVQIYSSVSNLFLKNSATLGKWEMMLCGCS